MLRHENQVRYRNQVSLYRNPSFTGIQLLLLAHILCPISDYFHYSGRVQQLSRETTWPTKSKTFILWPFTKSLLTQLDCVFFWPSYPFIWLSSFSVQ